MTPDNKKLIAKAREVVAWSDGLAKVATEFKALLEGSVSTGPSFQRLTNIGVKAVAKRRTRLLKTK